MHSPRLFLSRNLTFTVKVIPIGAPDRKKPKRLGFLSGVFKVPDDFDQMGQEEIDKLFGNGS